MAVKSIILTPFYRGDTPLLVFPVTVNGVAASIANFTGYLTFTTDANPSSNSDAFLHVTMNTDAMGTLVNPITGVTYGPNFNYQLQNSQTENFVPGTTYYWDVQINQSPTNTNNFTIASGTFVPLTDYGRGLS